MHFDQLLLFLFEPIFLVLCYDHFLELCNRRTVEFDPDLLGCPPNQARGQVDLDFHPRVDLEALRLVIHDRLCNLFPVRLVSSVVLDFYVEVETALTGI